MTARRIANTAATLIAAGALGACGVSSSSTASSHSQTGSRTSTGVSSTTSTSTAPTTDNGIAAKSPAEILTAAVRAAVSARSVHVVGMAVEHGHPITFDLHLVAGRGSMGEISTHGLSAKFVTIGSVAYLNGGTHFWRAFTRPALAQLLDGRWIKVPPTVSAAKISRFSNLSWVFGSLLKRRTTFVKLPVTTFGGQPVVTLRSVTRGGTLYVAATGPPYPIAIRGTRTHPGEAVFNQYNQPISLRPPANAVNAASLTGP